MLLDMQTLVFLPLLTLVAGFISAVSGGSSMLVLPALLVSGIPPHMAMGTNRLFVTSSLCTSAASFFWQKIFDPRYWLIATIATVIGALLGVVMMQVMDPEFLKKVMPFLIALVAVYSLFPKKTHTNTGEASTKPNTLASVLVGAGLGIYSGFLGVGSGVIWSNLVMVVFKKDVMEASGVARFMCFISNITALIVFMFYGSIDFKVGILISITGMLGAYLGARIMVRLGVKYVQPLVFVATMIMLVQVTIDAWA